MKLDGYKTYIVAACVVAVGVCQNQGWITAETAQLAWTVLAGSAMATFRSALRKA